MDPVQTLHDVVNYAKSGDRHQCRLALERYWDWRDKGGLEPPDGDATALVYSAMYGVVVKRQV